MRLGKLRFFLSLWEENRLLSQEQREKIFIFMKERRGKQFFRLIRWLFVLGAFWIVFGFLALVKLFDFSFLKNIYRSLKVILTPFLIFLEKVLGPNYPFALFALLSLAVWVIFFGLGSRIRRKESLAELKWEHFQESRLRSATVFFVISYIAFGMAFSLMNRLLLPAHTSYYASAQKIIPVFYMLAVPFFGYFAYRLKDQLALLFGIYFIALSVGVISGYGHACYFLSVSRPVVQLLLGIILVLVGFLHSAHSPSKWREEFGRTYCWTGLLMGFLALWIMSLWGIGMREGHWQPGIGELWFGNLLFLAFAIGALAYGAFKEDPLFFNYGLTFLIIETYTVFFSHLWENLGAAFGSLVLGCLTIGTGYFLRRIALSKKKKSNPSIPA